MPQVRHIGSVVLVLGGSILAMNCSSSSPATQTSPTKPAISAPALAHPTVSPITGKWVNPTAAVTLSSTGGVIKQRSGTVWKGDLNGKTTFNAILRSDPKRAGFLVGTIDEVFTGSVRGIGHGRLFLIEQISVSGTGALTTSQPSRMATPH